MTARRAQILDIEAGRSLAAAPRPVLSSLGSHTGDHSSPPDSDTGEAEMSFETYFTMEFDLYGYQRQFPQRAAAYFQASGLSAAQIAVVFGVTERTAMNWLEGIAVPRGAQIALVAVRDPDGFRRHFSERAA